MESFSSLSLCKNQLQKSSQQYVYLIGIASMHQPNLALPMSEISNEWISSTYRSASTGNNAGSTVLQNELTLKIKKTKENATVLTQTSIDI